MVILLFECVCQTDLPIAMNKKSFLLFWIFLNIFFVIGSFFISPTFEACKFFSVLLLLNSFYGIYLSKSNFGLLLMFSFIAYANYSVAIGVYLYPEIRPDVLYEQITNKGIYLEAVVSMVLFSALILLPFRSKIQNNVHEYKNNYSLPVTKSVEYICLVAYIVIFITQTEWSVGERMTTTAIGEYKFVFAIIGSIFAVKTKKHRRLWSFCLLVSSGISFVGGNRVDSFPALFVLLLVWFPNISLKKVLICGMPLVVFMKIIGTIRGNPALLLNFDLGRIFSMIWEEKFVQDTFTFAYFPSLCSIELCQTQTFDVKSDLFLGNISFIFWGGGFSKYILSTYTSDYYIHYGGFFGPLNLNHWMGVFGSFIIGMIVLYIVNKLKGINFRAHTKSVIYAFGICFICICPRWYIYNFFGLFRTMLFFSVLFFVFFKYSRLTQQSKKVPNTLRMRKLKK